MLRCHQVPNTLGIALPRHGIASSASGVRYSFAAVEGPIPEGSWTNVQEIPGLLDQTAVAYGAADGIGPTSLNISFTASAPIEIGGTPLPDFHAAHLLCDVWLVLTRVELLPGVIQVFLPDFPQPLRGTRAFNVITYRHLSNRRAGEVLDTHFAQVPNASDRRSQCTRPGADILDGAFRGAGTSQVHHCSWS